MESVTYSTGKPCRNGHLAARYIKGDACVECNRIKTAKYAAAHPEKLLSIYRNYYAANRERRRSESAAYRAANPERHRASKARTRAKHREKIKAFHAAWSKKNAKRCCAHSNKRRALKVAAPGRGISPSDWQETLDAAIGLCVYCAERFPLAVDHIDPLSLGGAHDPENAVASCKSCNSSKGDTPLLLWLALRTQLRRSLAA